MTTTAAAGFPGSPPTPIGRCPPRVASRPGAGTFVSAVHSAVGRLPVVAGKPEVAIYEEAVSRFGASKALFLGDRLDTDILGSNRAGIDSALVLTGIDTRQAGPGRRPGLAAHLSARRPEPIGRSVPRASARPNRAARRSPAWGRPSSGAPGRAVILERRRTVIDLLRAGAAAIWNSGMAIYALDVPPALYQR